MGAPKGNKFWEQRSKHGRDKIFETPEIMWNAACEYFEYISNNPLTEEQIVKYKDYHEVVTLNKLRPFTLTGLCLYLDVNTVYFTQFENALKEKEDEISKDFSKVVTRIRETIYSQKFDGAAANLLNPNIIARDLGLMDKTDITSNGKTIGPYQDWTDEQIENEIKRLKSQ
jgi:hypothetical protein